MMWKTKSGEKINIKDMTLQHLINAKAHIEKTNRVIMHEDLEDSFDNAMSVDFQFENPKYKEICNEIERRRNIYIDSAIIFEEEREECAS